jgi:SAM-dependent methyltransferase
MSSKNHIINAYDKTAEAYANSYKDELYGKHTDRILLKAFATETAGKGRIMDFGCGPGHTTGYLFQNGLKQVEGSDISPGMVTVAKKLNPAIPFCVLDMLQPDIPDNSFAGAIAFYSIVHFPVTALPTVFSEIRRVLKPGSPFLFSFHVGNNVVHRDEFLGEAVDMDFYFFETETIAGILKQTGFDNTDILVRDPYPEVEYPSKRAYIWTHTNK